jgi:hypothetical protein
MGSIVANETKVVEMFDDVGGQVVILNVIYFLQEIFAFALFIYTDAFQQGTNSNGAEDVEVVVEAVYELLVNGG